MDKKKKKAEDGISILSDAGRKPDPGFAWTEVDSAVNGENIDYLHFHNYLEIGFCYEGQGRMLLGEEEVRFSGREFSVIPPNYPHTTDSDLGTISRWEYLFIDVEGFLRSFLDTPVKADKVIQRIYSKALFLEENQSPSISAKILKIMNIMRDGEEFYLEEAKGILASLLVEIARLNRRSEEERVEEEKETYKYDYPGTGFCVLSLYGGYQSRRSGPKLPYQ